MMQNSELCNLLESLCLKKETAHIEFKLDEKHPEQIGEYISALANGACIADEPFAYLVWGVEDSTCNIKGTRFKISTAKKGNQDLELWLRTLLTPKIHFEIYEFTYNILPITLLKIPAAIGEPVIFQSKGFIRINSQKTELKNHPSLIRKIYNSLKDWSVEVVESASLHDLSPEAVLLAKRKFAEKNPKYAEEIKNWDDITFLDRLRITFNGKM